MSQASTNCTCCVPNHGYNGDFWELTNFGTNVLDLTGYLFLDKDGVFPDAAWPLPSGLTIRPNESVIFARSWSDTTNAASFRRWWGEGNLPVDLQIFFYPGRIGFDHLGDGVRLWDASSNLVDQVYFGETQWGFTFAYDTNSGAAVQSEIGVCGAFQAATCTDVGSPGWAPCGPVALRITQEPISQSVDAGSAVMFSVQASGLPRPRGYQWYFNGVAISNAAVTADSVPTLVNYAGCGLGWKTGPKPNDLTILNAQSAHAGQYFVVLTNGLERMTSAVVTLTVNTNPSPPQIVCPPLELCFSGVPGRAETNLVVAPLQTAQFAVLVRGYPAPTFRWSWSVDGANFVNLPNATNSVLAINFVQPSHAGTYRVRVANSKGTNYAYATLTVKEKPRLKITEAMSDGCLPAGNDWWELTNIGDEPVNLCGYRWDDGPGNIGGGPTITNAVIIQPGESVILLEGTTPEFFIEWWGASNLPPGLQIIRYTANGLEFDGDEINIWNPTATDDCDFVDSVAFGLATRGASFWFDPEIRLASDCPECGIPSLEGQCGAFHSAQGCDIGSPGWTRWTPPRLTSIHRDGLDVRLEWKAQPGSTNLVQYATKLASPASATVWNDLRTCSFVGASCTTTQSAAGNEPQRFYRVKMIAPASCSCPPTP